MMTSRASQEYVLTVSYSTFRSISRPESPASSKGKTSRGGRKRRRREPLGGSGDMRLRKCLKSRGVLQELFVIYAYRELFTSYTVSAN